MKYLLIVATLMAALGCAGGGGGNDDDIGTIPDEEDLARMLHDLECIAPELPVMTIVPGEEMPVWTCTQLAFRRLP